MTSGQVINAMNAMRGFLLHTIEGLNDAQFLRVPAGFKNNILWNAGHIVCVQCALVYRPSGKPLPIPEWYHEKFYDGTSPEGWEAPPSVKEVMGTLKSVNETVINDFREGVFAGFKGFELGPGLTLHDAEEALNFHTVHEGIHLGVIMALKKLV